jgi:hypothetical protein
LEVGGSWFVVGGWLISSFTRERSSENGVDLPTQSPATARDWISRWPYSAKSVSSPRRSMPSVSYSKYLQYLRQCSQYGTVPRPSAYPKDCTTYWTARGGFSKVVRDPGHQSPSTESIRLTDGELRHHSTVGPVGLLARFRQGDGGKTEGAPPHPRDNGPCWCKPPRSCEASQDGEQSGDSGDGPSSSHTSRRRLRDELSNSHDGRSLVRLR